MWQRTKAVFLQHRWALMLLGLLMAVGLASVNDFGITWDEHYQLDYGQHVHAYVHRGDQALHDHRSRYHGPAFQYVLYQVQDLVKPSDQRDVYRLRHVMTFLFSIVGTWFFYLLLLEIFKRKEWALLGVVLLWLSPRIASHSFYNSKDAAFMYMFIIAVYTMVRMLRNLNWRTVTVHAIACAWLIDMRILGAFVPMFTGILLLPRFFWHFRETMRKIPQLLWFAVLLLAAIIAFWPTLWHGPFVELRNAITTMSAYPWDDPVRFMGEFVLPRELPWYYLPWWAVISTPLIHLALLALGAVAWLSSDKGISPEHRAMVALWAIFPLAVIISKGAVVYDGWRHVFFVWPALVVLAVAGARWGIGQLGLRVPSVALWLMLLAGMAVPLQWTVRNHPHQAVFFNSIAAKDAWKNYEMDYWGASYLQALEWLAQHEPADTILLVTAHLPGLLNQEMLDGTDRSRLMNVGLYDADYFISTHRYPREFIPFIKGEWPYDRPLHQIRVDGNIIVGVYDLRK